MRNRFLMSMLASVCIASGIAAEETTIIPTGRLTYLPSFSQDGKGFAYTYSYEDDETNTMRFCIYDENLQMVKEFVTIPGTPNDYLYQTQERESKPIGATIYDEYQRSEALFINDESEGLSIEMVLTELNHREPDRWEISIIEDNVQVVASRYYNEETFGKKYPQINRKIILCI